MTTFRPHWRRLVPAALFSAAVAIGTVGSPAIASATWDIEVYDACIKGGGSSPPACCLVSIGSNGVCHAPAPEAQGSTETKHPRPPRSVVIPTVPVLPRMVG